MKQENAGRADGVRPSSACCGLAALCQEMTRASSPTKDEEPRAEGQQSSALSHGTQVMQAGQVQGW